MTDQVAAVGAEVMYAFLMVPPSSLVVLLSEIADQVAAAGAEVHQVIAVGA